jgi:hypothetical protein
MDELLFLLKLLILEIQLTNQKLQLKLDGILLVGNLVELFGISQVQLQSQ